MKEAEIVIYDQNIWGCTRGDDVIANRPLLIAELLDYHDADIVALQECAPGVRSGDGMKTLLGEVYSEVSGFEAVCNHTPILYKTERFSVIEAGYFIYERQRPTNSKSITHAVFEDKETLVRFAILSAHFWWRAKDETDDEIRLYNARVLKEKANEIKEKYDVPVFLMGDFNCGANSLQSIAPYLYLKEEFLDVREVAPISTDSFTHHESPVRNADGDYAADERCEAERTLDHVFVTEHRAVAVDSFEVDTSDEAYASSDHYPLIVRARIFGE